ncbi:gibberellin-regulated protein 14 [Euphorbia lathyris]|uniref:gibberellin-regulated protein 14 n=1 Tax=Euphorbia lathyris TaxID=212925 RepID=UPI0033141EA7
MAFKAVFFLLAAFLSLAAASYANQEFNQKDIDSKIVAPTPQVKAPPVPTPAPAPTPVGKPPVVIKPPTPAPPVGKPPVVIKPPTPAPVPPVVIKPPTPTPPTSAPLPPVRSRADCIPLCAERCKKHSRKNVCERACMTCCERCKCVPPGTYGNREKCGICYTSMTTRGNKPKCP